MFHQYQTHFFVQRTPIFLQLKTILPGHSVRGCSHEHFKGYKPRETVWQLKHLTHKHQVGVKILKTHWILGGHGSPTVIPGGRKRILRASCLARLVVSESSGLTWETLTQWTLKTHDVYLRPLHTCTVSYKHAYISHTHVYVKGKKDKTYQDVCAGVGWYWSSIWCVYVELGHETDLLGYHTMLPNLLNLEIKMGQKQGKQKVTIVVLGER